MKKALLIALLFAGVIGQIHAASFDRLSISYKEPTGPGKWKRVEYRGDMNAIPMGLDGLGIVLFGSKQSNERVEIEWSLNGQSQGQATATAGSYSQGALGNITHVFPRLSPGSYSVKVTQDGRLLGSASFRLVR